MSDLFKKINWELLRKQKMNLVEIVHVVEDNKTSSGESRILAKQIDSDVLQGIVNFIDAIQDYAVDSVGIPSKEVFALEDDQDREDNAPSSL